MWETQNATNMHENLGKKMWLYEGYSKNNGKT